VSGDLRFDVVGAEDARRYFRALNQHTMAHAYLFTGPAGVGKKTFARRLAQSLLCEAPKEGLLGYDSSCASCTLFAGQHTRHPDFVESDGPLKIGGPDAPGYYQSDELTAREIPRLFSMESYVGGMRVLLLGDVAFATHESANALLKFLEESPAGIVTILTSAAPGTLLPTIVSRTVEVRFPRLTKTEVRRILLDLGYASDSEKGASLAHGSVASAIAALDTGDEALRAGVARWFFDSVAGRRAEREWATRETLDDGLHIVRTLARDWIVARSLAPNAALLTEDYGEELSRLPVLTRRGAADLLVQLDEAARLSQTNVPPATIAEYARLALAGAAVTKSA
jgi:DNA polymerase-3 subunit delta'